MPHPLLFHAAGRGGPQPPPPISPGIPVLHPLQHDHLGVRRERVVRHRLILGGELGLVGEGDDHREHAARQYEEEGGDDGEHHAPPPALLLRLLRGHLPAVGGGGADAPPAAVPPALGAGGGPAALVVGAAGAVEVRC